MRRSLIPALVLITFGALFLLDNLGVAGIDASHLISTWWPLAPILIGINLLLQRHNARCSRRSTTDTTGFRSQS